jgi:hypothetical protein
MGKPTSTKKLEDGTEIWTCAGSDTKDVDAEFLVLSDRSNVTEHTTATVEIRDGVVARKWVDSYTVKVRDNFN